MGVSINEVLRRIDEIERFLRELIEVNLQLIEEVEPEEWEKKAIDERGEDDFVEWDVVKHEL
ncbi:hypothetical protein [Thermococcus sp. Bubb.Bath]|uniref:hypothetical protein n=1 Tax=Thermococcus sp. Bubb.Bath TaxID=1638242 RepID=UPI00143966CC|nr:hypothetical protein [Thermococcus sp. Bubb.Bath]NJF24768.1 hypothetical protein [Thermococcus sp. Bubb.Bath]